MSNATPLDARERTQLCLRFEEFGPDAPTLCEGWTTFDLAAHLVVRERNPLAAPGAALGDRVRPAAAVTEWAMEREKARGYAKVVERVRTGPPPGLFALPGLGERMNFIEYLVHHEDVRRANGMAPRFDVDDVQDRAWRYLGPAARLLIRGVPKGVGLELVRPTGEVRRVRRGERTASVTGEPVELVLWTYGRRAAAQITIDGDHEAVAGLEHARFGI
ncbi:MAG: TIGR03085 family metal-binding protein [Acidimicrobiales bacterium]